MSRRTRGGGHTNLTGLRPKVREPENEKAPEWGFFILIHSFAGGRQERRPAPDKHRVTLLSILASLKEVMRVKLSLVFKRLRLKLHISSTLVLVVLMMWV